MFSPLGMVPGCSHNVSLNFDYQVLIFDQFIYDATKLTSKCVCTCTCLRVYVCICVADGRIDGVSGNGGDNARLLFDKMLNWVLNRIELQSQKYKRTQITQYYSIDNIFPFNREERSNCWLAYA